ncbi:MAG TPA: hypothetical protein VGN29_07635 [Solirubrobacteraceae bacterium]|nr:hypothetical protein [Solirubrobacteraceae bacterium]
MKDVHLVVGVLAIALNGLAALLGGWCWWRARPSQWFWRVLRAGQVIVVVEVVLGGVLRLTGHKASGLHVLYGVLPLLVAILSEQLRAATAQMVLDSQGFESNEEVGGLPPDEQRALVTTILQREIGVMALSAVVVVVLLARAAATAG